MWKRLRRDVLYPKNATMKYFVFEAGGRCGFSAELFFRQYKLYDTNSSDVLYLVDKDPLYSLIPSYGDVVRCDETKAFELLAQDRGEIMIFPADELTRQSNELVKGVASRNHLSKIDRLYYDKTAVNIVFQNMKGCRRILVPTTMICDDVCIRPKNMSAGTKGVHFESNVCVTEKINIQNEYVVDVLSNDDGIRMYAREVKLRSGYDKMIRFLPDDDPLYDCIEEFVKCAKNTPLQGLFTGIFHLQIAKDTGGLYFYIESSKRMSGTSIVNIVNGYNPFCFINGIELPKTDSPFKRDVWYRYEDILIEVQRYVM